MIINIRNKRDFTVGAVEGGGYEDEKHHKIDGDDDGGRGGGEESEHETPESHEKVRTCRGVREKCILHH